jgi:hypothetical protein
MKTKIQITAWMTSIAVSLAMLASATPMSAQAPARFVGTITAISGTTITVKPDQGEAHPVNVPPTAVLKRIAPGQKDLSTAETIQFSDLAIGDRALVKLDTNAPAGTMEALQIVAMKQADLALKQQKDRDDWQRRGVGGLVKSVDSATGTIVLTSGAGATAKTVTVHTTKTTMLKRYAPASVRYDEAQPAPIEAIHAGDQLRARGEKKPDGSEIAAEEAVSGSFRNIGGTIATLDAAGSTLVVKDLATKKQVTIHFSAETQMRRLPDRMAQMLAMRLKGTTGGQGGWGGNAQAASGGAMPSQRGGSGQFGSGGQGPVGGGGGVLANGGLGAGQNGAQAAGGGGQWAGQGGGDPQQMLSRAPVIQLTDLKKGDAVMLVSTDGTTDVTAITLLAGVEPLLEAPAASQNMLSNWSMGGGASAADSAQ